MERTTNIDCTIKASRFETALKKFIAKYSEAEIWKEMFEYLHNSSKDCECDDKYADGSRRNWTFCCRLDEDIEGQYYFALVERA